MRRATVLLVVGLGATTARGEEFAIVGPRAMGMGGAGVATTRGSLGMYWNPAALAPPRIRVDSGFDFALPVSFNGSTTEGLLSEIDDLVNLMESADFALLEDAFNTGRELTDLELQSVLNLLEQIPDLSLSGISLIADVNASLSFRMGKFGFSALGLVNAGGVTNIDDSFLALGNFGIETIVGAGSNVPTTPEGQALATSLATTFAAQGIAEATRIADELVFQAEQAGVGVGDPAFQALLENLLSATDGAQTTPLTPDQFFTGNQSGVNVRGIALQEYAIGFAQPLFNLVSVGISAKFLYATTYFNPFPLGELGNFQDVITELVDAADIEEDINFGLDLGVLVMPTDWLTLGLVGKYLNRPEFDFGAPDEKYVLEPQFRAGVALGPFHGLLFAVDVDLLNNETDALPGFDAQTIGGGVEYNLFDMVFLRAGASKNLAESDEDVVLHVGVGARFAGVSVDLAGMMATDYSQIQSLARGGDPDEIPERVAASLMLSIMVPLD